MKTRLFFWLLTGFLGGFFQAHAQQRNTVELPLSLTVPEVAIVDFQNSTKLITSGMNESGGRVVEQILTPGTGLTWLNYTSIVSDGASNYISACISQNSLPADVVIKLQVSGDAGEGMGALGSPVDELTLSSLPQNIVTNIGSCFTGKGLNKGHRLLFIWEDAHGNPLPPEIDQNLSVSITYTIASTQ